MEVFNLNIRPGKTCPVIHCSQFDKGRTFRANLYDGSEVFTLTAAETLSVIEKKSDGNMVTIGVTNTSDSYVEFATTEQMTALAGPQICELRIVEGDTLIGSANFILDCEESPDTGIESESEIHNLETQIQDINEQIVPDMVAEEVANQYDSQNVIFDDHPTEGHGTGYVVKSENVPDELYDLDDVNIDDESLERGQALVYNPGTGKWENDTIPQTGTIENVANASFSDGADGVPVSELIVDIEAVQDLHDYDKPWVGGAYKNKYKMRTTSATVNGITVIPNSDQTVQLSGTATGGATSIPLCDNLSEISTLFGNGGTFILSLKEGTYGGTLNVSIAYVETQGGVTKYLLPNTPTEIPAGSIVSSSNLYVASGTTVQSLSHFAMQLESGSTATSYAPYSNICPITGHDSGLITVDTDQFTNTYTVDFGQTVYGGSLNVTTGELTITHTVVDLGSLTWSSLSRDRWNSNELVGSVKPPLSNSQVANIICSALASQSADTIYLQNEGIAIQTTGNTTIYSTNLVGKTPEEVKTTLTGVMLVYELATPIEIQLTPVQIKTLLGNNNIFADTGNIRRLVYFKTGCENIAKLIEAAPNLASVQSVNGRTGAVELDADNIPYDSENSIAEKIEAIPTYASQMSLSPTDDTTVGDAVQYSNEDSITASITKLCAGRSTSAGDKVVFFYPLPKIVKTTSARLIISANTAYAWRTDGGPVALTAGTYNASVTDGGLYIIANLSSTVTGNRSMNVELSNRTIDFFNQGG